MSVIKELAIGTLLLSTLMLGGTYYYAHFDGLSTVDAFYFTFLTITSVGSAYSPETAQGKIVTTFIVMLGMGTAIYIATLIARIVIEGQTTRVLSGLKGGFIRMKKQKNHIIVCGYGRLGEYVCDNLKKEKEKFLIIEKDSQKVASLLEQGIPVMQGDALDHETLKKANVEHAKVLIGTLGDDADNIYLIMSATEMNPNLLFGSRAKSERAVSRLHKVGAQIVVLPEVVGGEQLAKAVIQLEHTNNLSTISTPDKHSKKNK